MEKIAILVDSGSDISPELIDEMGIHVLPLKIIYGDRVYSDGEDIEPQEVYARFPEEIPKTSTPNFAEVTELAEALRDAGYTHLLAVCISSGLSGTYQNICTGAQERAGHRLPGDRHEEHLHRRGARWRCTRRGWRRRACRLRSSAGRWSRTSGHSRVFYYMDTLDYLRAGGRIGRVTGALGSLLNIKPIISCNPQGVYYTVAMIRGRKRGIQRLIDAVAKEVDGARPLLFAVMHGDAPEAVEEVSAELTRLFPKGKIFMKKQINASLAVHTGPGLVGILLFQPA